MAGSTVLSNWFAARVERTGNRRALTYEGATWTYADMWDRVERATWVLRNRGVQPGDRVGYVGANHPSLFVMLLAANRLGASLVPTNFRLTGPELAYLLGDAGVAVVVADPLRQPTLEGIAGDLPSVGGWLGAEPGGAWEPWEDAATGAAGTLPAVDGSDVATIMYTSGTTGRPKGVVMTHDKLWWGALNGATALEYGPSEVTMVSGPMFHVGGFCSTNIWTWLRGGEVIFHRDFAPATVLADVARYGVRSLGTVTALLVLLAQDPGFDDADLSSLEMVYCGGSPMPDAVYEQYAGKEVPIQMAYGSTESIPVMAILGSEWTSTKRASIGRPAMWVDLQLVADGKVVTEPEVPGEVWVRGPSIFDRYWGDPAGTAASFSEDGWFMTGDVARRDADGFLYLVDRLKDMIKSGGESISAAEVERVLQRHPGVQEVAVVAAEHPRWGETPVAVVVAAPGASVELDDLRTFGSAELARYKLPTGLVLVDDLPKGPSGKVQKHLVRSQLP